MKVHITLVGSQPLPVYHGIVATDPDKVVYIYSKQSDKVLVPLNKELSIDIEESEPLDPTDASVIYNRAMELAEKYKNDIVTVNISSGTKAWSHIFGLVFSRMPNATVVSMDQNNILWDYRIMNKATNQNYIFDMDVVFRLQGNELKDFTAYEEYTKEDKSMLNVIKNARNFHCGQFNDLTLLLKKENKAKFENQKTGRIDIKDDVFIEWSKPDHVRMSLLTKKYGVQIFDINSPHATGMVFNTGWFEYNIAKLLANWKYSKEIRLNCIFPPKNGDAQSKKFPKNEIDIIVNTGQKLLFVECKTMLQNSTDIDKFRTAVKNYGGIGSKSIFITENEMTPLQKEKCEESGIPYFSFNYKDGTKKTVDDLFALLEQELFNINIK